MNIDYDSVAELYDTYVSATCDHDFFLEQVKEDTGPVLELMAGTGRLSLPLMEAGTELTCVDCCYEMLSVLERKLTAKNLNASTECQDLCRLSLSQTYNLAILPFQSFMEILGEDQQSRAIERVHAALKPNGRFICTMHNPAIRRSSVDGHVRLVGEFAYRNGRLVVSGVETGGEPVVSRLQFFECFDATDTLAWKHVLPMRFELIEHRNFKRMAEKAGFLVEKVLGDYAGNPFDEEKSPVMIWMLRKPTTR